MTHPNKEDAARIFANALKAAPRTAFGLKEAAKAADCSAETMSHAKCILAEGTQEEITAAMNGEVGITGLGRAIRKGVPAGERLVFIRKGVEGRIEKQREDASMYGALKDALIKITSLPRPADVAEAAVRQQRAGDVDRCLAPAIEWLKEFDREYSRAKAA